MKRGSEKSVSSSGDSKSRYSIDEEIIGGTLYLVATPIGNLNDISFRAIHILENVNLVAAEDTRRTRQLLERFGISASCLSYHEHNAQKVMPGLIKSLLDGTSIALVSDAGSPTISDPGFKLVREAVEKDIKVVSIPGPSAVITALAASGLPTDRFAFEGFLPRKKGRQTRLKELAEEPRTMIFFESPLRLKKTLNDLAEYLGKSRSAVVCRELTKKFEEFNRGSLEELCQFYEARTPKGEITLVIEGRGKQKTTKSTNKYA